MSQVTSSSAVPAGDPAQPDVVQPGLVPPDLVSRWGGVGHVVDLDGPVYWVDFGGPSPAEDPAALDVLLVHGLGGNHLNWVQVAPELARRHRVRVIDLPGFGYTPTGMRAATVQANADLVARFVREVIGGPVALVGNSMGGLISLLVTSRHPALVERLVLVDPALPVHAVRPDPLVTTSFALYSLPRVGEAFLRRLNSATDESRVRGVTTLCFADPNRGDIEVFGATVAMLGHRRDLGYASEGDFLQAARSLLKVVGTGRVHYLRAMARVSIPVLLIHGERDRLVPFAVARKVAAANPGWATAFLPGVGHTPMMEVPRQFLDAVQPFLDQPTSAGATNERVTG